MRKKCICQLGVSLILLWLLTLGVLAANTTKSDKPYSAWDKAAYLTPEQVEFIRPGLKLTILSINIPDTRKPVIQFKITDEKDQPLDREGVLSPGTVSTSWVLARINPGSTQYTAYTTRTVTSPITKVTAVQASSDSGGSYKKTSDGVYEYTFGTTLPADYPKNATTTLGVYSTRDLRSFGLKRYVVNLTPSFVPDKSEVKTVRDVVVTATCNLCHNPLYAHGGSRQEVLLCNLCHYPGVIDPDTGNTVDMKVMVHKIHRGNTLPSVVAGKPYVIIGNQQSVHDYSSVGYPSDVRDCDYCHQKAKQADNWFKVADRETCGSCHDDVDFKSGKNHAAGAALNDNLCTRCHMPEGDFEFDASIKGGHAIPRYSKQLDGYTFAISKVEDALPGKNPKVYFSVKNNRTGASVSPKDMYRLTLSIAGPTEPDYSYQLSERISGTTVPTSGPGYVYTFTKPLPADAQGTFIFGIEGYHRKTINPGQVNEVLERDRGKVAYVYVAVTGSKVFPRRAIVDDKKCNACHYDLIFHGVNRDGVQYCVTCHNPTTAYGTPVPETIDFRYMIHKIHTGEELAREFKYGNTSFNEVRFPGYRGDCLQCHLPGTYEIPLADGRLSVTTKKDFFTPTPPETAACLSCHDSKAAAAHAYANISPFGESCSVCHGTGADFTIAKVHARTDM